MERRSRLGRAIVAAPVLIQWDITKVEATPNLGSLVKAPEPEARKWAETVHVLGKEGHSLLVFYRGCPMVIRDINHVIVSGFPGFEISFSVPPSGRIVSHDKYSSIFVWRRYYRELRSKEKMVLEPSVGRTQSNLRLIEAKFPALFEQLKAYIKAEPQQGIQPTEVKTEV